MTHLSMIVWVPNLVDRFAGGGQERLVTFEFRGLVTLALSIMVHHFSIGALARGVEALYID